MWERAEDIRMEQTVKKIIITAAAYLGKQSKRSLIAQGAGLALLVGISGYLLGREIGIAIFYLIPICLTTWFAGRIPGVSVASISVAIWLAADVLSGGLYAHRFTPFWNILVRLGLFVVVVFLLDAFKREKSLAREDYLTGLGNRRHFFELAEGEIMRSQRYGHPFTLAYIDVDDFKVINDRFGHAEGDAFLKSVAHIIKSNIRATDVASRLGGDEFAVLLPESGSGPAMKFIDKLHEKLSDAALKGGRPVSFSIGAVTFIEPPDSVDEMIRIVDNLMYSAKAGGKNRVLYESFIKLT
jgi:diguanylate cyclase (GGDEF)-like protein